MTAVSFLVQGSREKGNETGGDGSAGFDVINSKMLQDRPRAVNRPVVDGQGNEIPEGLSEYTFDRLDDVSLGSGDWRDVVRHRQYTPGRLPRVHDLDAAAWPSTRARRLTRAAGPGR